MVKAAVRRTIGRMVFELTRGEEKTTRTIDVPYAKTDTSQAEIQTAVNDVNYDFVVNAQNNFDTFIQPAAWRDTNDTEEQWTSTGFYYEVVETITTQITPTNSPDNREVLEQSEEQRSEEPQGDERRGDENQQGEWNG